MQDLGGTGVRLGASLVSLTALLWAGEAAADTTISSNRSQPINTSTVNNGAADNVVIGSGVSVTPSGGAAVTLDSDNTVTNNGTIQIQDQNDATGVLVLGGHTGAVTTTGTITVNETTATTDTNGDGVADGPFATGLNRYGIRVTGAQPFAGDISESSTGVITVRGEDSAAISIETTLQGSLSTLGGITMTGDRSVGVRTQDVTGSIAIGGSVSVSGENAQGVVIGGNVGGAVDVTGAISVTGYHQPTRSSDATAVAKLLASDLLQGGPGMTVAGDVAGGVLVDTGGAIASSGTAPALLIGASGRNVALGNVGTGTDAYGLEIKGAVSGLGVYDGFDGTAIQLGVAGGGTVNTGGGVHISGTVSASGASANATGLLINAGVTAPIIQNDGAISIANSGTGAFGVQGVVIQPGAHVAAFANSASLSAAVSGPTGDAVALRDLSGTLTSIQNIRSISAVATAASGSTSGQAIAIDVSANTTGVSLLQYDSTSGVTPPSIVGSVLFGSGADIADIQSGTVTGDLAFGAGANALKISGGASVTGAITADGGSLALSIASGSLQINNTGRLNLSSLSLAGSSALTLTVDPQAGAATELEVAGAASIASGAKLGLRFTSLLTGSATYTVIHASQLSAGAIDTSLLGAAPFIYKTNLATDAAAGTVALTVTTKTPGEVGLSAAAANAFEPTLEGAARNATLQTALLAQTDQSGFLAAFNQLLPDRSSAFFQLSAAEAEAVGRAIDDRVVKAGGAWVQEINYGVTDQSRDGLPGYRAWGVGLVGGYEHALPAVGVLGLTFGFTSAQVDDLGHADTGKLTANALEGGVYWRGSIGRLSADARVGGDLYRMTSDRVIAISNVSDATFGATATSHWDATGLNARFHLAYEWDMGAVYLTPQVTADYVRLSEDAHQESGGGDAVDLAIDSRTSSRSSAFAGLAIGRTFGDEAAWGPELLVGYRSVFSEDLGDTTARFVAGGDPFTLAAEKISGQGFAAHLAFKGENGYGGFALEGGAETRDGLTVYDLRLAAHFQF